MGEELEECPECGHTRHYGLCPVKIPHFCFCSATQSKPHRTPWSLHRTGSHIGIRSADGKFVFRKTVSKLSSKEYDQLSANLEFIVRSVNESLPVDN